MTGLSPGRIRASVTALAVAAALLPTAAARGAEEGESRLYLIERTTAGPTTLILSAGFGYGTDGAPDGLIAMVGVRDDPQAPSSIERTVFGSILSDGGDVLPEAYADGERIDCSSIDPPMDACRLVVSGGGTGLGMLYEDEGGPDDPTRIFVAVHGMGPAAQLGSDTFGWTIREVPPTFSFVRAFDSRAIGARSLFGGAEVFLSSTAAGGEHGSVAVGQPPCGFPMFEPGAGATLLQGGKAEPIHVCGAHWGGAADVSDEPTTWRLEGASAGGGAFFGFGVVRLLMIDLPPPCDDEDGEEDCEDLRPR